MATPHDTPKGEILIVDDNPEVLEATSELLQLHELPVITARNGPTYQWWCCRLFHRHRRFAETLLKKPVELRRLVEMVKHDAQRNVDSAVHS
jgi:hypothetical protein